MPYIIQRLGHSNKSDITCDYVSDIAKLPNDCYIGSIARCLENSKTYVLNTSGEWIERKDCECGSGGSSSGGGSGASAEEIAELQNQINELEQTFNDLSMKVLYKPE